MRLACLPLGVASSFTTCLTSPLASPNPLLALLATALVAEQVEPGDKIELYYLPTCWTLTSSGRLAGLKVSGCGILVNANFEWIEPSVRGADLDAGLAEVVAEDVGLIFLNLSPNQNLEVEWALQGLPLHRRVLPDGLVQRLGLSHLSPEDFFFVADQGASCRGLWICSLPWTSFTFTFSRTLSPTPLTFRTLSPTP